MPSTYAHFRAGQAVRQRLEPAQQQDIRAWPELYQIGLHGPDILFYYHPYTKTGSAGWVTACMRNPALHFSPMQPMF